MSRVANSVPTRKAAGEMAGNKLKIIIVGAGPGGLVAALHLNLLGFDVTVF